jgi:hypothetical protein
VRNEDGEEINNETVNEFLNIAMDKQPETDRGIRFDTQGSPLKRTLLGSVEQFNKEKLK